jgi:HEAT repeat protein
VANETTDAGIHELRTQSVHNTLNERLKVLILALSDDQVSVRWNACKELARMGPDAKEALPTLSRCLIDRDATTALWARYAIAKITGEAAKHLPLLIRGLSDKRVYPGMAATAIAGLGAEARDAVAALIPLLSDAHADNRWSASVALAQIGPHAKEAVPALIEALKDLDEKVRHCAAFALGEIGPEAQPAVPELITRLDDFDDDVRGYSARALGKIGSAAREALPALETLQADENGAVREEARIALHRIGQMS